MTYYNIHTHRPSTHPEDISIMNILIREPFIDEKKVSPYRSYGIHPWFLEDIDVQMETLTSCLNRPDAIAVGEAGLNKAAEADMALQTAVFHTQALLAEKTSKPLIIHCVKAWQELLTVRKNVNPHMPWIIHGFRTNGELATQLLHQGFYLSFGEKYNPGALQKAWPDHLLVETDTAPVDIREVYEDLAASLSVPMETFATQVEENTKRIFHLS